MLLEIGADPDYEDHGGFPPLIAALSTGRTDRLEIIDLLLSFGADLQQHEHNGYTPLNYAAAADDAGVVRLLLERGADPRARTPTDDRNRPLEEAEMLHRRNAAGILRSTE